MDIDTDELLGAEDTGGGGDLTGVDVDGLLGEDEAMAGETEEAAVEADVNGDEQMEQEEGAEEGKELGHHNEHVRTFSVGCTRRFG